MALFLLPFLADRRALFFAERRAPFFADFRDDRLAAFLAPLRADFLAALARLADFLVLFLVDFLRGAAARVRVAAGSLKSSYDEGLEVGDGAGVFSIGNGSIQPEPDQPISI